MRPGNRTGGKCGQTRVSVFGNGPGASSERERRHPASGSAVSRKIGDDGVCAPETEPGSGLRRSQ